MRCEECRRYFTPAPKPQGYEPQLRKQAIKLYLEGVSLRGIGRQLNITHQSVSNWINTYHDQLIPGKVEDDTPAEVVEVDELYTFVGKKREKAM
jgi:transposase-like protein